MTETIRRQTNRDRCLLALVTAGAAGLTNRELLDVAGFRYGGRVHELRESGWDVQSIKLAGGLWRFILKGRKPLPAQLTLPVEATR